MASEKSTLKCRRGGKQKEKEPLARCSTQGTRVRERATGTAARGGEKERRSRQQRQGHLSRRHEEGGNGHIWPTCQHGPRCVPLAAHLGIPIASRVFQAPHLKREGDNSIDQPRAETESIVAAVADVLGLALHQVRSSGARRPVMVLHVRRRP